MGGYSSGRYRTRNRGAVEASLRLDMRIFRRQGLIRPGERTAWTVSWSRGGQPSGSISVEMDLTNPANCFAILSFTADGQLRSQTVVVEAVPCRFGGLRYFFHCPRTFDRCVTLCGVGGHFASRQYHRLTYYSQSEDHLGRMHRARAKAEAKVVGSSGRPRPRGANRERLVGRWIHCEEALDDALSEMVARRFGHFGLNS